VLAAAGRIYNCRDLSSALGLGAAQLEGFGTTALAAHAWRRWGERAPEHLIGDWAFAVWDPSRRALFLARDHHGAGSLYYCADDERFAFATSREPLLRSGWAPLQLDELYLAQLLACWPAYHGERTPQSPIRRLPPAHRLSVRPDSLSVGRYWRLEDTAETSVGSAADHAEALRQALDLAVRERVAGAGQVGATLSGARLAPH
jgi:asparagine synthase (glutamine-hydrolysing)